MINSKRFSQFVYPWIVISLCALFLFYKYILQVSPSVMTSELMRFFHIQAAGLGNLAATFFYAYLIMQLFAGPLLDKYSPRLLMTIALFICALGTLIFSLSQVLWLAAIGRMLVGAGAAFATVGYMKMAAVYFPPKKFALVGGLLATAAMIGAVLGEAPMAFLVEKIGWDQSLFSIAIAGFIISTLFFIVVRDKKNNDSLPSVQAETTLSRKDFLFVLKNKHNWLLALYSGMAFAPVAVFGGLWGNPFLQEAYHLSKMVASDYASLVFIGLAVGGPVLGWLSDRFDSRLTMMASGSVLSLISLIMVVYTNLSLLQLAILLFTFGFGTGGFMLGFAMGKDINPTMVAGTVIALINTGDAILGAITEPLVGKMLDTFWTGRTVNDVHYYAVSTYQKALFILISYLFISLVLTAFLKKEKAKGVLVAVP